MGLSYFLGHWWIREAHGTHAQHFSFDKVIQFWLLPKALGLHVV